MMQTDLISIVMDFLQMLENRQSSDDLTIFYHSGIVQTEYPNILTRSITERNLSALMEASSRGLQVLKKERYDVQRTYQVQNTVIAEVLWTGTLNVPLGTIPVGGEISAHFAQFYDFEGDKIIRQRNYDCFDPFE